MVTSGMCGLRHSQDSVFLCAKSYGAAYENGTFSVAAFLLVFHSVFLPAWGAVSRTLCRIVASRIVVCRMPSPQAGSVPPAGAWIVPLAHQDPGVASRG